MWERKVSYMSPNDEGSPQRKISVTLPRFSDFPGP